MSFKNNYDTIRAMVMQKLSDHLSKDLHYHGIHHTIDVEIQAGRIAKSEKINNKEDIYLLKLASLYHDTGFLITYKEHELAGCNFARNELPEFGLTPKQIEIICGMIMATKIPQTPLTKLEEIICDADLDYLGRDDFFNISHTLFMELQKRKILSSEKDWNDIQINFIKKHNYFTDTNKKSREKKKLNHLELIQKKI